MKKGTNSNSKDIKSSNTTIQTKSFSSKSNKGIQKIFEICEKLSQDDKIKIICNLLEEKYHNFAEDNAPFFPFQIGNWYLVIDKLSKKHWFGHLASFSDSPSLTFYNNTSKKDKKEILGLKFVRFINDNSNDTRKFY